MSDGVIVKSKTQIHEKRNDKQTDLLKIIFTPRTKGKVQILRRYEFKAHVLGQISTNLVRLQQKNYSLKVLIVGWHLQN